METGGIYIDVFVIVKACVGGVEVYLHSFLTPALDGGEWPFNVRVRRPPRASMDGLQKR